MADDDWDSGSSDSVSETSSEGYLSRLGSSIGGMLVGLLLIPLAVMVLYWNEGRAVDAFTALNAGAAAVVQAKSDGPVDPALEGKLVHLTGAANAGKGIADPQFGIGSANALRVMRNVQMYQWSEETKSESSTEVGGTKTTKKTYTYTKKWSDTAIDSTKFKKSDGHVNPKMAITSQNTDNTAATLGGYTLGKPLLAKLRSNEPLPVDPARPAPQGFRAESGGYYWGQGNEGSPQIGDYKVSFTMVPAGTLSVVGGVNGGILTSFTGKNNFEIAMATPGSASSDQMFAVEKSNQGIFTWILRLVGFLMMLAGFWMLGAPLAMLFAFLPFLEGIADFAVGLVALMAAVPATLIVIALSWMAHRPLLGVGLLIIAGAAFFGLSKMRSERAPKLAVKS